MVPASAMKTSSPTETATAVEGTTIAETTSAAERVSTAEAAMKAAIKTTATVEAATKETISVPKAKARAPETKPGTCADENAAREPVRAVIAVGCASVGIIAVIAIGTDGSWAVINRASKSNAEGDALGMRVRSREETNSKAKTE